LEHIELHNTLLQSLTHNQRITIFQAFAAFIQQHRKMEDKKYHLIANCIHSTVRNMGEAFELWHSANPILDHHGQLHVAISQQLKSYSSVDPQQKHRSAILPIIFKKTARAASTIQDSIMSQLVIGAFFFEMRSCKYLLVKGTHKTETVMVKDILFYKQSKLTLHAKGYASISELSEADVIVITF